MERLEKLKRLERGGQVRRAEEGRKSVCHSERSEEPLYFAFSEPST
jgi:hypothetical protein